LPLNLVEDRLARAGEDEEPARSYGELAAYVHNRAGRAGPESTAPAALPHPAIWLLCTRRRGFAQCRRSSWPGKDGCGLVCGYCGWLCRSSRSNPSPPVRSRPRS